MYDPFFQTTYDGTREGADWLGYWDETNSSGTPSQSAADAAYQDDSQQAQAVTLFNGGSFFVNNQPFSPNYAESGSGQFFVSSGSEKRAPFADAAARQTAVDVAQAVVATARTDGSYYNQRNSGHALNGDGTPRDPIVQTRTLGDNSWLGMSLLDVYRFTGDGAYLAAARAIRSELNNGIPMELIAIHAQEAIDSLGQILGTNVKVDVLDHIFSQFCIGK